MGEAAVYKWEGLIASGRVSFYKWVGLFAKWEGLSLLVEKGLLQEGGAH